MAKNENFAQVGYFFEKSFNKKLVFDYLKLNGSLKRTWMVIAA